MTIYYTVNTAFIPYLETFKEELNLPNLEVNQNWTTQKQVLPISLQSSTFNNKLPKAPGILKGLVQQYRKKSQTLDNSQENKSKHKFFDNVAIDTFLFIVAIISMLEVIAIIHITCRHAKLKSFINRNYFSANKTSRSSGNQSDKTVLYSTMVYHCSINNDDNTTYCLYLSNQSEMYYF